MTAITPQSDILDRLEALGNAILTELRTANQHLADIRATSIAGGGVVTARGSRGEELRYRRAGTRAIPIPAGTTVDLPTLQLPLQTVIDEANISLSEQRVAFNWLTGERKDLLKAWARGDFNENGVLDDGDDLQDLRKAAGA